MVRMLAGVINVITKKPTYKSIRINAHVQEETVGKEYKPFVVKGLHTYRIGASFDNGKWNAMTSVLHYNFTGFGANKNGRAHSWKPKEQWMPSIRIGYKSNKTNIYYRNDYLHETITAKAAMNNDTYKAFTQQFITNRMAQQLQGNYFFNKKNSLNATVGYTNYQRNTKTTLVNYENGTQSLSNGDGEQDIAKLHSFNFRSTLQYYASSKIIVQPGIEINYEKAMGARIKCTPAITNYSFFLSAEYKPMKKLNIRSGFRINKNSSYNAPPFMPSLNMLYNINDDFSLRAAYARGYRAPALWEFYFNFVDANHNLKGNPNLKAEHSQSINVSINYKKNIHQNIFSSGLAGFYNVFTDLIDLAINPENNREFIYINVDKYKTAGLSLNNQLAGKSLEVRLGVLLLA